MRLWILFLLLGWNVSAAEMSRSVLNDPAVGNFKISDPELGDFLIKVINVDEPAIEPYRVSLSVSCRDHQGLKPPVKIVKNRQVHQLQRYSFDRDTKILTLYWSTASAKVGEAEADENWSQTFNLRALCR